VSTLKIGGGHRLRKALFVRGLKLGTLNVDEIEAAVPPGMMTAAERWLLYFSLRAAEVELRDSDGRILTPDDLVPEHRRRRRERERAAQAPSTEWEFEENTTD
jgi:hypothetical protein